MEKSFIKSYLNFLLLLCVAVYSNAEATKIQRLDLNELVRISDIVAIVEVKNAELQERTQSQVHTSANLPIIKYTTNVIQIFKAQGHSDVIEFEGAYSILPGQQYLIFLSKHQNDSFNFTNGSYSAFEISTITFGSEITTAVRIPYSFIALPNSLKYKEGYSKLNEQSSYVWVKLSDMEKYMDQTKSL